MFGFHLGVINMSSVLLASTEIYTGKTGIALTLALEGRRRGHKVGYMKPVGNLPAHINGADIDKDAAFVARKLEMSEEKEVISPVVLRSSRTKSFLKGDKFDEPNKILSAYKQLAENRDLMVMEGSAHINDGRLFNVSARQIAELLDARVLLIMKLDNPYEVADDILVARDRFGGRFMGAVCNWVPRSRRRDLVDYIYPYLKKEGIKIFGFIPRESSLLSVSVGELTKALNGNVLCGEEYLGEMVESFMVGAMGQEQALRFFQRQSNKAVITGGDRADVQLAALETPTKALILTGNYTPSVTVLGVAESKKVPLILVDMDTMTAVDKTESIIGRVRVHEENKLELMQSLIKEHVDLDAVFKELG